MKNVINKNTILALMVIGMMCFWGSMNANAQQFNVQGDLVSSYVWRGMYQTGASIQPTLGFSVGNFSLTAWGSTDFDGTSASAGAAAKEIDLTAAYTLGRSGLTVSVADLWWAAVRSISLAAAPAEAEVPSKSVEPHAVNEKFPTLNPKVGWILAPV